MPARNKVEDSDVEMSSNDDSPAPSRSQRSRRGIQDKRRSVEVVDIVSEEGEEDEVKPVKSKKVKTEKESGDKNGKGRSKETGKGAAGAASSSSKNKSRKLAVDEDDEEDEEDEKEDNRSDDSESEEDNEYVIEKIMKHRTDDDGTTEYLIRWEGYESGDDTWEPELVADYWKVIPTSKQPRKMQEAQAKFSKVKSPKKKASIKSTETSETEEADEVASALDSSGETPTRKKRKASKDSSQEGGGEAEEEKMEARLKEDKRLLRKWEKTSSWEDDLEQIVTMERADDSTLRAQVKFKNGEIFWVERLIAYQKCPQKMLSFYEERLRFRFCN
ncbi:hypothetical protein CBS101457_003601 [Exobasidium rhododendri]|nr:hypothetical protein CBS101457_003601 [Exobasidium rhododendri]